MAILRYTASADNTISNSFNENMLTNQRATGSNMGKADIVEVFSIYGQDSGSSGLSSEISRGLIKFDITKINSDRTAGTIPAQGSVKFYLKMFNAAHSRTLPEDFIIRAAVITRDWQEGYGLDMDNYKDKTYDGIGSNWMRASKSAAWTNFGGDFLTTSGNFVDITFNNGDEDIEADVTTLVERWLGDSPTNTNYGLILKMGAAYEPYQNNDGASSTKYSLHNTSGAKRSFYTKKFFARGTEYFFKRPVIEARWDDSVKDDRGEFYLKSPAASLAQNLNNLYYYNNIRGKLVDLASAPTVQVFKSDGTTRDSSPLVLVNTSNTTVSTITSTKTATGTYRAQFAYDSTTSGNELTTAKPYLVDVWSHSGTVVLEGQPIKPKAFEISNANPEKEYVVTIKNLYKQYDEKDKARFRVFIREKGWSPNVYTVVNTVVQPLMIQSASFQVHRTVDEAIVIPYGTASSPSHTMLSHDVSGNYFDLSMNLLEPGYSYGIRIAIYEDAIGSWREQPYTFKFRVDKNEY